MATRLLIGSFAAAACVLLGGCGVQPQMTVSQITAPFRTSASAKPDETAAKDVNEDIRRILMAAGLDPANPSRPKEIRKTLAGVAQVRWNGRTYGTALIKPNGRTVAFADPAAAAGLLASGSARAELVRAFSRPLANVDSAACRRAASGNEKKFRKTFGTVGGCASPSGEVWVDLDRRSMTVNVGMRDRLMQMVAANPGVPQPTRLASSAGDDGKIAAAIDMLSPQRIGFSAYEPQPVAAPLMPTAMPTAAGALKIPPDRSLRPPVEGPNLYARTEPVPRVETAEEPVYRAAMIGQSENETSMTLVAAPQSAASVRNYVYDPPAAGSVGRGGQVRVLTGAYEAPPSGSFVSYR